MRHIKIDGACLNSYDAGLVYALDCDIQGFLGNSDNIVKCSDMIDWKNYTANRFYISELNGGHFDIF